MTVKHSEANTVGTDSSEVKVQVSPLEMGLMEEKEVNTEECKEEVKSRKKGK